MITMANTQCTACGGELMEGYLAGKYITQFYPAGQEKKLFPKHSKVLCTCCKKCGLIQLRAAELDKIR